MLDVILSVVVVGFVASPRLVAMWLASFASAYHEYRYLGR